MIKMKKRIARVFPRRTKATPIDDLAFIGSPGLFPPKVDEVHISVTFTWDIPKAEKLKTKWKHIAPVKIGGPATGMRGEDFNPGMYLKPGYVITSRGCPNKCWFCSVWKREGQQIRELPITEGFNIADNNLLACSEKHFLNVIEMLKKQTIGKPIFTGGLEAARLQQWQAEALFIVKPVRIYFAYDEPNDWEPLVKACDKIWKAGFKKRWEIIRAYVLCGYPKDTLQDAEKRMYNIIKLGLIPYAMLYMNEKNENPKYVWKKFHRKWTNPVIAHSLIRKFKRDNTNENQ